MFHAVSPPPKMEEKVTDLEDTIRRIQDHKGVVGMMIINQDGVAVRTTMDTTTTNAYSAILSRLSDQARSAVRDLDPLNDITFLRMRSKKGEILLAPDKDFSLIVIQSPTEPHPEANQDKEAGGGAGSSTRHK